MKYQIKIVARHFTDFWCTVIFLKEKNVVRQFPNCVCGKGGNEMLSAWRNIQGT